MPRRTSPNNPNAIYDQRVTVGGKRKRVGDLTGTDWASLAREHARIRASHAEFAALMKQMMDGTPPEDPERLLAALRVPGPGLRR